MTPVQTTNDALLWALLFSNAFILCLLFGMCIMVIIVGHAENQMHLPPPKTRQRYISRKEKF